MSKTEVKKAMETGVLPGPLPTYKEIVIHRYSSGKIVCVYGPQMPEELFELATKLNVIFRNASKKGIKFHVTKDDQLPLFEEPKNSMV